MGNLRLKQILDWAMFVRTNNNKVDWKILRTQCEKFKMGAFLDVMNGIIMKYLRIDVNEEMKMSIDDCVLSKVMHSVFNDRDFVWEEDNKNRWIRRWHYVIYNIKYCWKLKIAGRPLVKQLWLYASTYGERN